MKKQLFISLIIFSSLIIIQCKSKNNIQSNAKKEVIVADHVRGFDDCFEKIQFYNDSTYVFTKFEKYSDYNDKLEKYYGKYRIEKDTILFLEHGFIYSDCKKAVVKNNFINFIDGNGSILKLKIKKSIIDFKSDIYFAETNNFAFFIFNPKSNLINNFDKKNLKPYDLTKNDLVIIDNLLTKCIKENKNLLKKTLDNYNKQCIAVINSNNEIEVFIDCSCKEFYRNKESIEEFRYGYYSVADGGYCFFELKLNLTLKNYKDLKINSSG